MSARYSKISSRGRAMVTLTVIESTGGSLCARLGGGACDAHDVLAVLGAVDELPGHGLLAAQGAAQLAARLAPVVAVQALPDERRPAAVSAALAGVHAVADAPAQQLELERGGGLSGG